MDSKLSADIARCPGADAVWCDHCRRREEEASALRAEIEQMKANAARQNKLMHLASKDIVFFGGFFYDPSDRAFRVPRPLVLCNDFFAPAADCEEFEPEDIDAIHDAYLQFGDAGVLAWVSLKRGGENPWRMKPGSELIAQFETAREAMRLNIPPGYREPAPVDFMGNMNSELPADIARCPGADAVWCDNCRRREPSSHPMQAWMETPACVDVRGCAWHIPHGYREPGPVDHMGSEGE